MITLDQIVGARVTTDQFSQYHRGTEAAPIMFLMNKMLERGSNQILIEGRYIQITDNGARYQLFLKDGENGTNQYFITADECAQFIMDAQLFNEEPLEFGEIVVAHVKLFGYRPMRKVSARRAGYEYWILDLEDGEDGVNGPIITLVKEEEL